MNADESSGRNDEGTSVKAKLESPLSSLVRRFVEWREDRRSLREHRRALASLNANDELGVLLRETGMTPEQIRNFDISPFASAALQARMMKRLGAEELELDPVRADELRSSCRSCVEWRRCRRFLDQSRPTDDHREFCRNARIFDEALARTIPRSSSGQAG